VRLLGLADDKGVQAPALAGGRVQHRGGDRVGSQREPADGVVAEVGGGRQHDAARQRSGLAAEQHPPQIDIPGRALPGRQHEVTVHDCLVLDHAQKIVAVVHSW
jgi:hypothetical protein